MGLKRMIWRSTPTGAVVDVLKNIREEGGISAGLKRTMKENVCEDNPITSRIYKKMNGKKKRTFILTNCLIIFNITNIISFNTTIISL